MKNIRRWLNCDKMIYRTGIFIFMSLFMILVLYIFFRIGYIYGNKDGLKKAYRNEMFKKYPEYFQDWNIYQAEINEDGKGKRGMK